MHILRKGKEMTDYEDLAFKPALAWGDLVEPNRSKALFYKNDFNSFNIGLMSFHKNGEIRFNGILVAENRTYEQMQTIIDNLYEE